MFRTILEIGFKIGKVVLDEKLTEQSKELFGDIFDTIDDLLND